MREIKFRVWDGENMISPDYISRDGYGHWKSNSIPDASDKLMQYTGLKDKNGVEIYEGDIVEDAGDKTIAHWISSIEWVDPGFCLATEHPAERDLWELYERDRLVVIGNIHENPEMLK